ncbi:hypothetical protein CIHG_05849 [Coccidioides immitis H538.4]|uniref:Uncharacterized protein n=1 Tax=Coccidioides immitis H538.4 TaxID=396776 RepID=A0A0J8RU11_COCIT|nr:hypothetical protein CIHG_05849 [Coccidioides immitis H538.4]
MACTPITVDCFKQRRLPPHHDHLLRRSPQKIATSERTPAPRVYPGVIPTNPIRILNTIENLYTHGLLINLEGTATWTDKRQFSSQLVRSILQSLPLLWTPGSQPIDWILCLDIWVHSLHNEPHYARGTCKVRMKAVHLVWTRRALGQHPSLWKNINEYPLASRALQLLAASWYTWAHRRYYNITNHLDAEDANRGAGCVPDNSHGSICISRR